MKQNYIVLFIFCFFSLTCVAQNKNIDSLRSCIKVHHNDTNKVKTLNLLSRNFWKIGSFDSSYVYAQAADDLSKKIDFKKGVAEALINKGIISDLQGKYPEAIKEFIGALKIFEAIDLKLGVANANSNIGVIYGKQGNLSEAEKYITIALSFYKKIKNAEQQTANTYNNLGNINLERQNYSEAIQYYNLAIDQYVILNYTYGEAKCLNNIGTIYKYKKNYAEAEKYYAKSLAIQNKIDDKNGMAITYDGLSTIYLRTGQLQKAKSILQKEMQIAKEIGSMDEIKNSFYNQSVYDSLTGNYKSAYLNYRNFIAYKDSILNEENAQKTMQMQMQYEYDKKFTTDSVANAKAREINEAEIATQKAELKAKRNQQIALYGGLILVGFFALFMYNRFKVTVKQRNIIEKQKTEVEGQKHLIEHQKQEIVDSVNYAQRIQQAILPEQSYISEYIKNYFLFYQPKDIVSGDFYFFHSINKNKSIIAVCDCTGHGVPGAFMSLIGSNALKQVVVEQKIIEPAKILYHVNKEICDTLKQNQNQSRDGMDVAIVTIELIDTKKMIVKYAGANRPLWLIKNNSTELIEYKPDKFAIGGFQPNEERIFTEYEITLDANDCFYLFSDGFADQFGGTQGKKMMTKKFKETLLEISAKSCAEQNQNLHQHYNSWKGMLEQVDDVLILGVKA